MFKFPTYRVRILHSYPLKGETNIEGLDYKSACDKFVFYVNACLEFPELNVRCVNIIKGKKTIKLFINHD